MRIVSTSKEVKCHLWPEGTLHGTYKSNITPNTTINTVSWAKDGGWMVLVPANGKPEIVSFYEVPKLLHIIQGVQNATCACFQTSTKRNVALGTSIGQLMIYDIKNKGVKKTFPYAPAGLFKLQYNYKGSHLIAGCRDGKVYIYNNNSGILSSSIQVPNSKTLMNFKCHPLKRNYLAGCSEEGIVTIWDINTSKSLAHSELHRAPVNDIIFTTSKPDLIVSLGMDSLICFYDYRANTLVHSLCVPKTPTAIDGSPSGNNLAVGFQDGRIEFYDLRNLKQSIFKFEHGTRIKQLSFENASNEHTSIITLPEPEEAQTKPKNESGVESNSFGNFIFVQPIPDIQENQHATKTKDSFLDAIGFNSPINTCSETNSLTLKSSVDSKPQIASPGTISEPKIYLKTQVDNFISKYHLSSTPVADSKQDLFSNISPIPTNKDLNLKCNEDEFRQAIREVVREEMEIFKKELRYQTWDLLGSVRRHSLDLRMTMVREFSNVEDKLEGMRKELE